MTRLILILCLLCAGCEPIPWDVAPSTHICTVEQMSKVEKETLWCKENTGYLSTYCYGTALIRNCEKVK